MNHTTRMIGAVCLFVAVLGVLCYAAVHNGGRPFLRIVSLEAIHRQRLPTGFEHVPIMLLGAKDKGFDVQLWETTYEASLEVMKEKGAEQWKGTLFCYEVTSDAPYSWTQWSMLTPLGMVRLLRGDGDDVYLAWVRASLVQFAEISQPRDRCLALGDLFAGEPRPGVHTVPVGEIVPSARGWGVDSLYSQINTVAISRHGKGSYTVTVADPQGKEYVLQSHGDEWRLVTDPAPQSPGDAHRGSF